MSKKEVDLQTKAELLYDYAEFKYIFKKYCCFCKKSDEDEDEKSIGYLYVL